VGSSLKIWLIFLTLLTCKIGLAKTYVVNDQHSFVNFELDYMKVSLVKGSFDHFNGAFEWDGQNLSQVEFEILVNSVNTRDPKRDNHLRRKDFFHISKYPLITFVGKEVIYKNDLPTKIKGTLTVRGVEKPYSFNLDWKGEYQDPVDKKKKSLFLKASTLLYRKDFNMTWNKALDQGGWVVGDKVDIEIIIEANPTDARPAFSRFYTNKRKILPGKLELPQNLIEKSSEDKTSSEVFIKKKINDKVSKPGHVEEIAKVAIGFLLFCFTCVISFFFKKKLLETLENRVRPLLAEFISDMILYSFLLVVAYYLAPLMGYGNFDW
jgi:polyisoprenoid-binding protein YceI